jgi:radical SAM protein (TIGR01212 family)
MNYFRKRYKANRFIVYFQPYSNTYASLERLKELYQQALCHPDIIGISVGTRPDCIDREKLAYLAELARDYFVTVEYGIESVFDQTLANINRGHDYACTVNAVQETAATGGIHVCGHLILGFPEETKDQMLTTVATASQLPLDFIKLHNLHIVRYTELARQFAQQPFHVFSFEEWIHMACDALERMNPQFIVERLHGDAPKDILIAPGWCRDGAKILYAIQNELEKRNSWQGKYYNSGQSLLPNENTEYKRSETSVPCKI